MSGGREAVHARRARLVERAAAERDGLADQLGEWRTPLGAVDQGLALIRGLKRNAPVIGLGLGAVMAALAFIRPPQISGWLEGGRALLRLLTERDLGAARNLARVVKEARSERSEELGAESGPAA